MLDARLHLQTPEGISLPLTPAGPAVRAQAWLMDWLIRLGIGMVLTQITAILELVLSDETTTGIGIILMFALSWGYPLLFEVYGRGMTPGKRVVGIQVLRHDGLPVGWRESFTRNLLMIADFLPIAYGTGLMMMLGDAQFRRLGDIVAGTLVVYREKPDSAAQQRASELLKRFPPRELPFPLQPEEQQALLDLAERVGHLPESRRNELGDLASNLTGLQGDASMRRLMEYTAGLAGELPPANPAPAHETKSV